jgi:hypothetical protein
MKYLLTLLMIIGAPVAAMALQCLYPDQAVSQSPNFDTIPCTGSGYCTAYDYNPATGQYENFYGFHITCNGQAQRETMTYTCRRANGTTYTNSEVVFTGTCAVN